MCVAKTTSGMKSQLRAIHARLIGDPSDAQSGEGVIEATSGAAVRYYAVDPKRCREDDIRGVLASEGRRSWIFKNLCHHS